MSKGFGPLQQAVIHRLMRSTYQTTRELAAAIYERKPREVTRMQAMRVDHAIKRLVERKLVKESDYVFAGQRTWMLVNARPDRRHRERHAPGRKLRAVVLAAATEPHQRQQPAD